MLRFHLRFSENKGKGLHVKKKRKNVKHRRYPAAVAIVDLRTGTQVRGGRERCATVNHRWGGQKRMELLKSEVYSIAPGNLEVLLSMKKRNREKECIS